MCIATITRERLNNAERTSVTAGLFGVHFLLLLEPLVYTLAEEMSPEYRGGFWEFYRLSNGGFYMAPASEKYYPVACKNGYEGGPVRGRPWHHGMSLCAQPPVVHGELSAGRNVRRAVPPAARDMLEQTEAEGILGAID